MKIERNRGETLSISEGQAVSSAFAAHGLATDVGVRLLGVGERSGSMGQTLERIAKLYDDEIGRWVDWFIAERRIPQDGRFKLSVKGQEIDYRVSVMPSIVAEDVVIRILDKRSLADQIKGLRLDLLGFEPGTLAEIRALAAKPYGMLLVTGPTGSGKTTTMYAALSEINNGQDKIITIEDPVEYVRSLSTLSMLANVYVVSHQVQSQDAQRPVRFVIAAKWVISSGVTAGEAAARKEGI